MSIRLFVGLEIPPQARVRLATLQNGIPDVRWVPPDNLHLTLRFIGDIEEPRLQDLTDNLSRIDIESFELTLAGFSTFGRGKPRALWVGAEPNPRLLQLQEKIERAIQAAGLPPEQRKFTPHVTLARFKQTKPSKIVPYLEVNGAIILPSLEIQHFTLFSSQLSHRGSTYRIEHQFDLRRGHLLT